jgi:hypothetical protein
MLMFPATGHAARTINSVTLNNATSVSVVPGDWVTLVISVTTDGSGANNDWLSTGWLISATPPGTLNCWNHNDHTSANTYSENTTIQVPSAPGTYNAYFVAYNDNSCSSGASGTTVLTSGVIVVSATPAAPTATTTPAGSLTANGAIMNGTISSNGDSTSVTFDYGLSASYGTSVVASPATLASNAANSNVSATLAGLTCNTTYHFRVSAVNIYGTTPGSDRTFKTSACVPTIIEFNSTGGNSSTNGLHFYIEDSTKIQVKRLNGSGQVYAPGSVPTSSSLDNGVFVRADGQLYGPSHSVGGGFTPSGGAFDTVSLSPASPANPSTNGVQQTAVAAVGINAGPQVTIVWKYTTPLEFLTAEVTLVIPAGYAVSPANPVRYYHAIDTYLGGSDQGCGVKYTDSNGKLVVGTYPPTSGSTCPSSTSLPPGAIIVESFRERTGTFSEYCTADWSSFYFPDGNNCAVSQANALSNTIVTTYRDTGVGIEYDFTAAGTYTFSYDFVIGTTVVPPYDHLEIVHDGAATLCPETVTVLACTSSTLPCPSGSIVNTGTLTGTLTTSPGSPAITKTPATITLGSSASTQAISLQAATAGTVTLGASSLSTIPLSGTKCWNTTTLTQSCSLTFANTPCVGGYECLETTSTYNNPVTPINRNPLYTKLSGTGFKFDVVALQGDGAPATSYTAAANVTVDLFDDSAAPACASATALASQPITFAAGDNGRKTLSTSFNLPNAYAKVRCRVRDANVSPTLVGCSSDDFAVRPLQFTVSSTNANADATGTSPTLAPKVKAGTAFALTADTATAGYGGTPTLDASKAAAHAGAVQVGALAGSFGAATVATGNGATGAAFTYGEVGYFRLNADAVVDNGFTLVDSATGDCVVGSSSNTVSIDAKVGCSIGNAVSAYFGRFIPDHFDTSVQQACSAFSYSGQPFAINVKAMNAATPPLLTQNYDSSGVVFSKAVTLEAVDASAGSVLAASVGALSSGAVGASTFRAGSTALVGTVTVVNGSPSVSGTGTAFLTQLSVGDLACVGSNCFAIASIGSNTLLTLASTYTGPSAAGQTLQLRQTFTFTSRKTIPTNIFVRARETSADSVTSLRASGSVEGGGQVRSGRIQLQNRYGSEVLALPVPVEIQYWSGNWKTSAGDTCTSLLNSQFAWSFPAGSVAQPNNLVACYSAATLSGANPSYTLTLNAPGTSHGGWADLVLNLGATASGSTCTSANAATGYSGLAGTANAPWLQYPWTSATDSNPSARVTFGIYRSPLIYRRENY